MENNLDVTVFILSRDRPNLIIETIESVLDQTYKNFNLIISDNSIGDEVYNIIKSRYCDVKYIKRNNLTIPAHIELILSEVNTKFFVMFHDDDRMHESFLSVMLSTMKQNDHLAAIGCNANVLLDHRQTGTSFMNKPDEFIMIETPEALIKNYLTFFKNIAPFPSYFYRTDKVRGILPKISEGGKWADVSYLMKILVNGNILWLGKPLIDLRYHSKNHSGVENIPERLSLLRFIYKNTTLKPHNDSVLQYRLFYWLCWFRTNPNLLKCYFTSYRTRTAVLFMISKSLHLIITNQIFRWGMLAKIRSKLAIFRHDKYSSYW